MEQKPLLECPPPNRGQICASSHPEAVRSTQICGEADPNEKQTPPSKHTVSQQNPVWESRSGEAPIAQTLKQERIHSAGPMVHSTVTPTLQDCTDCTDCTDCIECA